MLVAYLQPFQILLLVGLTSLAVALVTFMILKIIVAPRTVDTEKIETKYDARFIRALETLKKAYAATVKYTSSATIREMLRQLSSKFPEQQSFLSSIQNSMEGHAYGGVDLSEEDFKRYSKLTQTMLPARIPRGLSR